ncbi:hypothetical protein SLE2022_067890 [Rubroshorea leprosula]
MSSLLFGTDFARITVALDTGNQHHRVSKMIRVSADKLLKLSLLDIPLLLACIHVLLYDGNIFETVLDFYRMAILWEVFLWTI